MDDVILNAADRAIDALAGPNLRWWEREALRDIVVSKVESVIEAELDKRQQEAFEHGHTEGRDDGIQASIDAVRDKGGALADAMVEAIKEVR